MADLLERAMGWLAGRLKAHASRTVLYKRGESEVAVPAVIGRTLLKLSDDYGGVRMQWTDCDYLIDPADLVLNDQQIVPQRGDRIVDTAGDTERIYEVLVPGDEPEWRTSDPHGKLLRIHTKLIGTQATEE